MSSELNTIALKPNAMLEYKTVGGVMYFMQCERDVIQKLSKKFKHEKEWSNIVKAYEKLDDETYNCIYSDDSLFFS